MVLKSRDITLLTKVHIVKAMVFPAIMYRYKGSTIKKAEHWRKDAFKVCCRSTLESPLEIKPVIHKGNQPWIFIERTESEAPILSPPNTNSGLIGKDTDAGKVWGQEKAATEDKAVGWHHWLHGHDFEQIPGDNEAQGSPACDSPWGHKESDMT